MHNPHIVSKRLHNSKTISSTEATTTTYNLTGHCDQHWIQMMKVMSTAFDYLSKY